MRCETQMSVEPELPGRSELKYRLSPFLETAGAKSLNGELTTGPRLTGAYHSETFEAAAALFVTRPRTSRTAIVRLMPKMLRFIGFSLQVRRPKAKQRRNAAPASERHQPAP